MLNTAISDSGAIPLPTDITLPDAPFDAIASSAGVDAASSGVLPPRSACGRSPTPSSSTYIMLMPELFASPEPAP